MACSAGSYRYVDQPGSVRQAHRNVIEAADRAGLVPVDGRPEPHGAAETEVYGRSSFVLKEGEDVDVEKAQPVTIRTFEMEQGSRTELASEGWWLSPECAICRLAVSFPIDGATSTTYGENMMPPITVTRVSFLQSIDGLLAQTDSSVRYGKDLWSQGGQRVYPTGRHRFHLSGSLGLGFDVVEDSDGDGQKFVGAKVRPGIVLEHIYDRLALSSEPTLDT